MTGWNGVTKKLVSMYSLDRLLNDHEGKESSWISNKVAFDDKIEKASLSSISEPVLFNRLW